MAVLVAVLVAGGAAAVADPAVVSWRPALVIAAVMLLGGLVGIVAGC